MIIFDLNCRPEGHVFEAWFGSTSDYESQLERGLLACPVCSSTAVGKAPMAPRVGAKGNASSSDPPGGVAAVKPLLAALASAQRDLLRNSDFVGERFADEARAIHLGETQARAIHGRARQSEAESLIEEGIAIAPLLFPVVEPALEN